MMLEENTSRLEIENIFFFGLTLVIESTPIGERWKTFFLFWLIQWVIESTLVGERYRSCLGFACDCSVWLHSVVVSFTHVLLALDAVVGRLGGYKKCF